MDRRVRGPDQGLDAELRISLRPVMAVMAVASLAMFFVGDGHPDPSLGARTLDFAACILIAWAAAWALEGWRPWAGRWFTVVALLALVLVGNNWLGVPGFLTLLMLPTAVAGLVISLAAAAAVAVGETVLLLLLSAYVPAYAGPAAIATALTAVWATVGLIAATYRPLYQRSVWLQEYFQHMQHLLAEARERKVELEQALADLAHANQQLSRASERVAALRLIAEDAQKTKAAFVAKVSHEFRTPLNMIIGLVELIVGAPEIYALELPPKVEKDLEVVLRNCRHLSGMIDDVLDLTRMEAGRVTLHKERVNLGAIIDEAVTVVSPLVEKKGLSVRVVIPDGLPLVYCDRTRIRQVILNLVSNAARFTEAGGITIDVTASNERVTLRVIDTGPGIAPEDAARIFEPFSQGSTIMWRDKGGSGLGLSISQQFVGLHGGRLWLESELGAGSSFIFELPISPPMEHTTRPAHWIRGDWVWREQAFRTDRAQPAGLARKPRVVICDGTGSLSPEFARYLDEIELVEAGDLSEAIEELRRAPADVMVLNLAAYDSPLPVVERARMEAPGTPVVGCSVPLQAKRAVAAGALGHLIKPVSLADLKDAIQGAGRPVRRILLVDDDDEVLELFARMLKACDGALQIETASSGEQALEKLRRATFDLVLLDVLMPDMDGWQVLEQLRGDGPAEAVPVFFVSAQDPADEPVSSSCLIAAIDRGLSINTLLRCSLELSALLLSPEGALDPVPQRAVEAGPAWRGNGLRPELAPALPL